MNILTQRYPSLLHFMEEHSLTLPTKEEWRLTERILGEVNGIPTSYGILTATNGILCYIEQADGSLFGPAHIAFFIARRSEQQQVINSLCTLKTKTSQSRKTCDISDLI